MNKQFTYTLKMDAEIDDLVDKVTKARAAMSEFGKAGKIPAIEKSFTTIEKALERLQQTAKTPITSASTFGNIQKDMASVEVQLQGLGKILEQILSLPNEKKLDFLPPDLANKIKDISGALTAFSTELEKAGKKTETLINAEKELNKANKELSASLGKQAEAQQKLDDGKDRLDAKKEEVETIKQQIKVLKDYLATQKLYEEAGAPKNKKFEDEAGNTHSLPKARKEAKKVTSDMGLDWDTADIDGAISSLTDKLKEEEKALASCKATHDKFKNSLDAATSVVTAKQAAVDKLSASVEELNKEFETNKAQNIAKAFTTLRNKAESLGISLEGISVEYTEQSLEELQLRMQQVAQQGFEAINQGASQAASSLGEVGDAAQKVARETSKCVDEFQDGMEKFKDNSAILQRIKAFVGLQGGIDIARSAMRNAMSTIKELDAAMTEMAVVTDLEVGDYWDQLPEHTKAANELGVAISEVYKAETLYLQQGLKITQAQSMANETLKMAKIANLSAADATDKMTAALRGFNMELNETSAQRVADVYSELAAITAADVDEISSAMSKTASIASSAGMEFETTAAFLSQIIETTRESAETAGTAMKTVIARFQELKKAPSEIGEIDGEIVDANAIETALRSVGVSLRDTNGQFRELDQVFLELSSKWDSLDTNTQRYIATIAAGSRQQSRFIAMMSDYSRTQELVTAANNSAGASNEQFGKTLESIESKLAKLKNAWDSFTMGIMDSDVFKIAVDLLTKILESINKITEVFGPFDGAAKIGLLVAALYLGDKALKVFMNSLNDNKTAFQAFHATGRAAIDGINKRFLSLKKLFSGRLNMNISSESLKQATVATEKHKAATIELKEIETKRAAAAKAGTLGDKEAAMYSEQAREATQRRSQAEKELMATMGLSATQMEAVQALQALDVATGDALILTKAGISAATLSEITAINGEKVAVNASTLAQNLSNASGIRAISAKIGLTVANWAQTASENAKTGSLWASITATIAQTMANWGLQASMWPILVIGLAIAAALLILVGTIMLIVAAFKAWQASQPDAKMAALKAKTEEARESAQKAKEDYETLLNDWETYSALEDRLDGLIEGTTAWKEAVAELNTQVLELIAKYPELMNYLSRGENGVLKISEEGWEKIANDQQRRVQVAQSLVYSRKEKEINQDAILKRHKTKNVELYSYEDSDGNEITKEEYDKNPGEHWQHYIGSEQRVDYDVGEQNQEALHQLSQMTYGTVEYTNALADLRTAIGSTNTEQLKALEDFDKTAKTLHELGEQADFYEKEMLASVGSVEAQSSENYDRIVSSLVGQMDNAKPGELSTASQISSNAYQKWAAGNGMWTSGNDGTNDLLKEELAKYGLQTTYNEKRDMAALLAAKGGRQYTDAEIKDMGKGADDYLAKELAEIDTNLAKGQYVDALYELQENNETVGELYSGSLDIDLEKIKAETKGLDVTGYGEEAWKEMFPNVETYGKDEYFVEGVLTNAIQARIDEVEQAKKDVDLQLQDIFSDSTIDAKAFAGSYDQANAFLMEYNEMMSGVGSGMATSFAEMFKGFDVDKQAEFLDQYGDVKWDSSIEGAAKLKEMLESDDVAIRNFAANTLYLEQATYSTTAQLNEFYDTLSQDALKELAADGKITATEMMEMAKSNEKLATMMDTTGISASTLGKYYELLQNETISAYEATDNFIKALDDLNAASNSIEDSFAFIDTFEPSRSQTEISDYFAEMRESAMSLYDMGAYGDQQLNDYIQAFLGEQNWQDILDKNNGDVQKAMDEAMAQINSYGDNLYGTWKTLVDQGLQGVSMGEDGSIQFDMTQIGDVNQLKDQIMGLGWSEEMANALVADAQTFSAELGNSLKQVDVGAAFETWLSEAMTINGKTIIPEGQVEAMAKELGVTTQKLKEDLQDQGITVMDLVSEDGKLTGDMRQHLIDQAAESGEFDLDTNYQLLLELGLDDKEAKKELGIMAGSLTDMPVKVNGETLQQTSGVLYDSNEVAIEGATVGGLIDGLEDPKAKAAQELSAIQQGEMMAQANATGSIVASRMALQSTAQGIDNVINGAINILNKIPGVNIAKSNIAGTVASGTDSMVNAANAQISARNAQKKNELNNTINSSVTSSASTKSAVKNLTDKYTQNTDSIISSYNNKNAQESGEVQFEAWENAYDTLYNLNQDLNQVIRERERYERAYSKAVENNIYSAKEMAEITAKELASLQEEAKLQKDIAQQALTNIRQKEVDNTQYKDLYSFDSKTGKVKLNLDKIEQQNWSQEEGEEFEEFISYIEEQADTYKEAQDSLEDIEDRVNDIDKRGRDSTSDIYEKVKAGLVKQYEDQYSALENINNSINEASEALLSKIQEQIDEARQQRENEKTEKDIAQKEARLAYLQRDTSGANAQEILSLQKEIEEQKESHTDTLVDQAIEDLQKQNELLIEQNERQLEIMRAQLDSYIDSADIWTNVKALVDEGFKQVAAGVPFANTEAGYLAGLGEDVESMNPIAKQDFHDELEVAAKEGAIYEGFVRITGPDGQTTSISGLTSTVSDALKNIEKAIGVEPVVYSSASNSSNTTANSSNSTNSTVNNSTKNYSSSTSKVSNSNYSNQTNTNVNKTSVNVQGGTNYSSSKRKSNYSGSLVGYDSGGLADFTGPAWLDGTKAHPEMVLNSRDTANFIELKDILSEILSGSILHKNSATDAVPQSNTFDIDINVEHIGDDYDVEQLAEKVKNIIYSESMYRNVNVINLTR